MSLLKSVILPFVLLNLLLLTSVQAGCTNRENKDSESGVSEFFTNLGCEIASGAKKVKGSIEDGYDYIKKKVASDSSEDKGKQQPDYSNNDDDKKVIPLAPWPATPVDSPQPSSPLNPSNQPNPSNPSFQPYNPSISNNNRPQYPTVINGQQICAPNQQLNQYGYCQEILAF